MIDMDYLAEMHYAKYDPQYDVDTDVQEEIESDTCDLIEKFMDTAIDSAITMGIDRGMNVNEFISNNKEYILYAMSEKLDEYR